MERSGGKGTAAGAGAVGAAAGVGAINAASPPGAGGAGGVCGCGGTTVVGAFAAATLSAGARGGQEGRGVTWVPLSSTWMRVGVAGRGALEKVFIGEPT